MILVWSPVSSPSVPEVVWGSSPGPDNLIVLVLKRYETIMTISFIAVFKHDFMNP